VKKLLSFMISLALLLCCSGLNAYTMESEKGSFTVVRGLLDALEITDENFGEYEDEITRGEFIMLAAEATGIYDYIPEGIGSSFSDVGIENPCCKAVYIAKNMKLISGYGDNTFRPDEKITLNEAIVVSVNLLGLNAMVNYFGGYPAGYYKAARENKLLKGINLNGTDLMDKGNALLLIYNTLHAEVLIPVEFSDDNVRYETRSGDTLLKNGFGVELVEGILDGVDISSIYGDNDVPSYTVTIDGRVIRRNGTNANDYFGYNVQGYVSEINGRDSLIYICERENYNKEILVDIENVTGISDYNIITADEEGKVKKISYSPSAAIIYNGVATTLDFDMNMINGCSGTIRVLDNNKDGKSDIIFIEVYDEYVVGRIDKKTGYVYDFFNPAKKICLNTESDEPYTLLYSSDGEEISYESLKPYSSIVVYSSAPDAIQTFNRGYVSDEKVTGILESVYEENGHTYYVVNGNPVRLTKSLSEADKGIPGNEVIITLNSLSHGAYLKYGEDSKASWALLVKGAVAGGFEGSLQMKFMNSDGKMNTINSAEKIKIDGIDYNSVRDSEVVIRHLEAASEKLGITNTNGKCHQAVKYKLSSDGQIKEIDTALQYYNEKLSPSCRLTERAEAEGLNSVFAVKTTKNDYLPSLKVYNGKVLVADNAVVYNFPSISEDDEIYYRISGKNDAFASGNSNELARIAFFDSPTTLYSDTFIQEYNNDSISGEISVMYFSVITKITSSLTSDGEKCVKLYLSTHGADETVLCDPALYGNGDSGITAGELQVGDMIYYIKNPVSGMMENFQLRYRWNEKKAYCYHENFHGIENAYVYGVYDDGIIFVRTDDISKIEEEYEKGNYMTVDTSLVPTIAVIELSAPDKEKVRTATRDDFVGYDKYGTEASKLLFHYYTNSKNVTRELFIVKEGR